MKVKLLVPRRWEETKGIIVDYLARVGRKALKEIQFELDDEFDVGVVFIENPEVLSEQKLQQVQTALEKVNRYVLELKNDPWTVPAIRAKTVAKMRKDLFSQKYLALKA